MFKVLHICSAHIIKAVSQSIGRKTSVKGLKEFATFAFARLQNSTPLTTALKIFHSLCIVLTGKHNTDTAQGNLKTMQDLKNKCNIPDIEKVEDSPLPQEEDDEERRNARTIMGESPFTHHFKKVFEEAQNDLETEDGRGTNKEENPYFCPGVVDVLF